MKSPLTVGLEARNRLASVLAALEAARADVEAGAAEGLATTKRLAGALTGDRNPPALARVAQRAISAPARDALAAYDQLVGILRRVVDALGGLAEQSGARILIVEADAEQRAILEAALRLPGRELTTATTCAEAQRLLFEAPPHLVVLALALPDQDGRNLLTLIRERPTTATLPIIVVSRIPGAEAECFALGADAYLQKPVDGVSIAAAAGAKLRSAAARHRESRRDALTGLLNRAGLKDAFARAHAHALRSGEPLALAIVDLDQFKAINDRHGHLVGDAALREVGGRLERTLRGSDVVGRWGGDEFLVLLPDSTAESAARALEKVLAALSGAPCRSPSGELVPIAFSAGATTVSAGAGLPEALAEADQRLLAAKQAGRGRVVWGPIPAGTGARRAIVVLDPDPEALAPVCAALQQDGFDVLQVAEPSRALELDLAAVLWIVNLARLDVGVVGRLRRTLRSAGVPVLVLSPQEHDIVRSFELGADDYARCDSLFNTIVARARRLARRKEGARRLDPGQVVGAFLGDQFVEFVQMLGLGGKRGVLRVASTPVAGQLGFRDGRIVSAETTRGTRGEEAVFELLSLRHGRFDYLAAETPGDGDLDLTVSTVLLELLRRRDEALRGPSSGA